MSSPAPTSTDLPSHISSLDCKILQYQYSIAKLELTIAGLRGLTAQCKPLKENSPTPQKTDPEKTDLDKSKEIEPEKSDSEKPIPESIEPEKVKDDSISDSKLNTAEPSAVTPSTSDKPTDEVEDEKAKESDNSPSEATKISNEATTSSSISGESAETKKPQVFDNLPLMQYIVLLSGSLFAINENAFSNRLELLSNFKPVKTSQITISSVVTHVAYDHQDLKVTPLEEISRIPVALMCISTFETLCKICLQGYQKRLEMAKQDKQKFENKIPEDYYSKLESIIRTEIFNPAHDVDLTLHDLVFEIPRDEKLLSNQGFAEATLVDMDIKMLFVINRNLQTILSRIKILLLKLRSIKTEQQLLGMPDYRYSLHKIFLLTMRLNDLYTVFRKVGRKIYLSNYQHLIDQKLTFPSSALGFQKSSIINTLDEIFTSAKKNGTLIANMTRFVRPNSSFEVSAKVVQNMSNFVNQSFVILESNVMKFEDFGNSWINAELRFRKQYHLPKKNLLDLYVLYREKDKNEPAANGSRTNSLSSINSQKPEQITVSSPNSVKVKDVKLKKPESIDTSLKKVSSSSSVSSLSSNSSVTLARRSSLSSPRRNSLIVPSSNSAATVSPSRPRRNSMLFQGSESADETSSSEPSGGRKRSNSQPTREAPKELDPTASGAAAMALSQNSSSKKPSGRASSSASSSPPSEKAQPVSNRIQKQLRAVAEETNEEAPAKPEMKLSANQRLQEHLRKASKSGTLMTQEKEVFTSVIFNPNNPGATNLRRNMEKGNAAAAAASNVLQQANGAGSVPNTPATTASTISLAKIGPNRDQVTRRNTQRNSVASPVSDESADQSTYDSSSTSSSASVVKKVRFTGVPEYSEDEDAPSKYSNRILKNFAVFKNPTMNYAFKKRDQLLKREESFSFRHHLDKEEEEPVTLPAVSVNRFSKIKNKLL